MTGRRWCIVSATLLLGGGLLLAGGGAHAQDLGGQIEYTGNAGPIGNQRPLCLCVYSDAQLLSGLGCLIFRSNAVRYHIDSLGAGDYYLIAFVDLHVNVRLDPDEPFEIYRDRALPPGDPVGGQSGATNIDFIFGDENLPALETPTPTASPSSTPSASPSASPLLAPTATPSPLPTSTPPVPGDCDGDGAVTISELVRGVAIALGQRAAAECPPADGDRNGMVSVAELIRAVNAALGRIAP
jgi:hypothetical protein